MLIEFLIFSFRSSLFKDYVLCFYTGRKCGERKTAERGRGRIARPRGEGEEEEEGGRGWSRIGMPRVEEVGGEEKLLGITGRGRICLVLGDEGDAHGTGK